MTKVHSSQITKLRGRGIFLASPRLPSILYDLQGRRVTGSATRGIYVKDGRKVMVDRLR